MGTWSGYEAPCSSNCWLVVWMEAGAVEGGTARMVQRGQSAAVAAGLEGARGLVNSLLQAAAGAARGERVALAAAGAVAVGSSKIRTLQQQGHQGMQSMMGVLEKTRMMRVGCMMSWTAWSS